MTIPEPTSATGIGPQGGDRIPVFAGLGCYLAWGLLPILFIWAGRVGAGAFEIVAWRTIWSLPCVAALVFITGQAASLRRLRPSTWAALALSSFLIAVNWSTYVWAVSAGRTISASLGYYILPLLNMAAGAVLFEERISRTGWIAVALAATGVGLQGLALGEFPWVSVVLALSFCGYGIVRKKAAVEAQVGLLVECLILFAPAVAYTVWLSHNGHGVFGVTPAATGLLMLCGPATVLPLALFAFAARRLPLSVMGFLQFISPTLQFMVGFEAGESLTPLRILSFGFIWAGVLTFAGQLWFARAGARKAVLQTASPNYLKGTTRRPY
ncbi:EamA family transporter RarD [Caulobacter sp. S45]|uniref:EamA family transporter RarD n=1 Tax=Caulobacter sp. S45 TaxID=1641861 RepID=UPI0015759FD9|nr:EamA family transporter RarD [Caulobacter sp. S45]